MNRKPSALSTNTRQQEKVPRLWEIRQVRWPEKEDINANELNQRRDVFPSVLNGLWSTERTLSRPLSVLETNKPARCDHSTNKRPGVGGSYQKRRNMTSVIRLLWNTRLVCCSLGYYIYIFIYCIYWIFLMSLFNIYLNYFICWKKHFQYFIYVYIYKNILLYYVFIDETSLFS